MARLPFDRKRHIRYFAHSLRSLPSAYSNLDTNRLTLVHFSVQSLDLLGVLDDEDMLNILSIDKKAVVDWIYSLQVLPDARGLWPDHVGFKGGTFLGGTGTQYRDAGERNVGDPKTVPYEGFAYDHGHIAMTYTALCSLVALGDDLSRFHRRGVIAALRHLQRPDGSFQCISVGSENDMRFLFCACAISYMLNDWSGVDTDAAANFIRSCRSYDGAISLISGMEGHGGSTFCAISALTLMGRADEVLSEDGWREELVRWCTARQVAGLQGRPNKAEDTCYSYWIGGALRLLGCHHLLDQNALTDFVLSCQTDMGGFGKVRGAYPDLLHSFYSMAWLSLSSDGTPRAGEPDLPVQGGRGEEEAMSEGNRLQLNRLNCALGTRDVRMSILFDIET